MSMPLDPKLFKQLMARREIAKMNQGLPQGSVPDEEFDQMYGEPDADEDDYAVGREQALAANETASMGMDPRMLDADPNSGLPEQAQLAEMDQAMWGPQPTISKEKENQMYKYGVFMMTMNMMQGGPPA